MRTLIDIDDDLYTRLFDNGIEDHEMSNDDVSAMATAIRKGKPLPKGHGDLIDRSLLSPDSDYEDGLFYAVSIGQINGAPTIIEADKSESEESGMIDELKQWEYDRGYEKGKTDVLDKIRAEIVHLHDWAFSREEVLRIIDKYIERQKCDTCYHNETEFSICQYCTEGDKYEERCYDSRK